MERLRIKHGTAVGRLPAVLALLALLVAGCGGSNSNSVTVSAEREKSSQNLSWEKIDTGEFTTPKKSGDTYTAELGNGQTVHWKVGTKPTIAFFERDLSTAYLQANMKGAKDAAKAAGVELTAFDAQGELATQRNQIQNAIASGKFDAAVVVPTESQATCGQLTRELPEANIPVIVVADQTCGRDADTGKELWSPGTVSWVGNDWPVYFAAWAENVSAHLTSPTEAVMIGGPEDIPVATVAEEAAKKAASENANFKLVATARTDYTTGQALTYTQNLLQAHSGVGAILVMYGGQAPGVISAVKQAGKAGEVSIYDGDGGSSVEKGELEHEEIVSTEGQDPYTSSYCAVAMTVAMFEGKKVPRVVPNDCHLGNGSPDEQSVATYDKQNVSSLHPVY